MQMVCSFCGTPPPEGANFCIACGATLNPAGTRAPESPNGATGPTIHLSQPGTPGNIRVHDSIPLIGLLFGALFLVGFAQLVAHGALRGPDAGLIVVLLCGALVAERAWVNGAIWGGLRGMILWGGLTGLLAIGRLFPWGLLLLPVWLLIWLCARGRP